MCEKADLKAFLAFYKRKLFVPIPDYSTMQTLIANKLEARGAVHTESHFNLSTVAHIAYISGYTAATVLYMKEK